MSWLTTLLRRALFMAALAGLGSAGYSWWRSRHEADETAPPEWPPLDATAAATAAPVAAAPGAAPVAESEAARADGGAPWVEPNPDGSCPLSHPIKANDNSGIFHVPGGRFYDRTGPERCYASAEAAIADGYRRAKS